jgi:hypothetical protein
VTGGGAVYFPDGTFCVTTASTPSEKEGQALADWKQYKTNSLRGVKGKASTAHLPNGH